MKKTPPSSLLLFLLALCLITSCSKKSSSPGNPTNACHLITISHDYENGDYVTNLDYDTKGRLVKASTTGSQASSKEYTYSGDTMFINFFDGTPKLTGLDTVLLNGDGLPTTEAYGVPNQIGETIDSYTYTGTECIKYQFGVNNPASTITETYTWANGNPAINIINLAGTIYTDYYTYNDKPEGKGGYDMAFQILYDLPYLRPTNMMTVDSSSMYVFHIAYTFDANGDVTHIQRTKVGSPTPDSYDLQWQCNQ
jgi:hypothetical protein